MQYLFDKYCSKRQRWGRCQQESKLSLLRRCSDWMNVFLHSICKWRSGIDQDENKMWSRFDSKISNLELTNWITDYYQVKQFCPDCRTFAGWAASWIIKVRRWRIQEKLWIRSLSRYEWIEESLKLNLCLTNCDETLSIERKFSHTEPRCMRLQWNGATVESKIVWTGKAWW